MTEHDTNTVILEQLTCLELVEEAVSLSEGAEGLIRRFASSEPKPTPAEVDAVCRLLELQQEKLISLIDGTY